MLRLEIFNEMAPFPELVIEDDVSYQDGGTEGGMYLDSSSFQCIRFQPFQQTTWHSLCDHNLKEL